jgi:hypothetical protein
VLAKTWVVLAKVEGDQDHLLTLKALAGLDARLTLLAKLMGELREKHVYNTVVLPEWVSIRDAILAALEPYPEARLAVVRALDPPPPGGNGEIHGLITDRH